VRDDWLSGPEDSVLIAGGVRIDRDRREVRRGDRVLRISPRSYDLLSHLAGCAGRVVGTDEIIAEVWHGRGTPATVRQELHVLRRTLGDDSRSSVIECVRGAGYRIRRTAERAALDSGVARCLAAGTRLKASGSEAELRKAAVWFTRAAAMDPRCDAAWLGLATCRLLLALCGFDDPVPAAGTVDTALARASRSTASRLVALDADCFLRGRARLDEYAALREENPHDPEAHVAFAWANVALGETRAAAEAARAAVALAPASLDVHNEYGTIMYYAGAFDEAAAALELVAAMDPARSATSVALAMVLLARNEAAKAAQAVRFVRTNDSALQSSLAVVAARTGDAEQVQRCANAVLGRPRAYLSPYHAAKCYYALGRTSDYAHAMEAARSTPHGRLLRFERWMS
jgi:DNA-binding winged helix-turn-helix (wHTH) protein